MKIQVAECLKEEHELKKDIKIEPLSTTRKQMKLEKQ